MESDSSYIADREYIVHTGDPSNEKVPLGEGVEFVGRRNGMASTRENFPEVGKGEKLLGVSRCEGDIIQYSSHGHLCFLSTGSMATQSRCAVKAKHTQI